MPTRLAAGLGMKKFPSFRFAPGFMLDDMKLMVPPRHVIDLGTFKFSTFKNIHPLDQVLQIYFHFFYSYGKRWFTRAYTATPVTETYSQIGYAKRAVLRCLSNCPVTAKFMALKTSGKHN